MLENDNEKDFNEMVENNVRKAFGDDNVSNVMCGNPEEIKKMVGDRNKKVIDHMNDLSYSDEFDDKLRFNQRFAK